MQSVIRSTSATLIGYIETPDKDAAAREGPDRNPPRPVASKAKKIGKVCFACLYFGISQATNKQFIPQPDAVRIDDVALAISGNLPNLTVAILPHHPDWSRSIRWPQLKTATTTVLLAGSAVGSQATS
jgi:hypothetical protein